MKKAAIITGSLLSGAVLTVAPLHAESGSLTAVTGAEIRANLLGSSVDAATLELTCGEKKEEAKTAEHKCGEGKCGEKKEETKAAEHKCGEGKCGEGKCGEKKEAPAPAPAPAPAKTKTKTEPAPKN